MAERSKASVILNRGWGPRLESQRGEIYFPTQTRIHTFESKRGRLCNQNGGTQKDDAKNRVVSCRGTRINQYLH